VFRAGLAWLDISHEGRFSGGFVVGAGSGGGGGDALCAAGLAGAGFAGAGAAGFATTAGLGGAGLAGPSGAGSDGGSDSSIGRRSTSPNGDACEAGDRSSSRKSMTSGREGLPSALGEGTSRTVRHLVQRIFLPAASSGARSVL